jgi:hypothetical protein
MTLTNITRRALTGSMLALLGASPLAHADLQDDLNARWRGAWVIVTGELYSNCNGSTTDNRISGDLVSANGRYAFEPGELARVTKVDARRRRVDVFLDIYESKLIEYRDGPFTLYREVSCPVELLLEYGGMRTKDLGVAGVEEQFNRWFERYARLEDAEQSPSWNGRIREDYPDDYELTLAAYEDWKVEQHNQLVAQKIEYSVEQTGYLLAQVRSDSEFGAGLGYGIAAMRENLSDDCSRLVASDADTYARAYEAPNPDWGIGYRTGQQLAYHIEISRRLSSCYLSSGDTLALLD